MLEDLPHLKPPLVDAKSEVCRQDVHERLAHFDRCGQRAARLAPFHRQIDAMHIHDRMPREERVAEALLLSRLPRRSQRAFVAAQSRQCDRTAILQRDARRVRELLQRDDVGVQFHDDLRDAIGILTSVTPHALVHVVGRDANGGLAGGH